MPDEFDMQNDLPPHVRAAARPGVEAARLTASVIEACWPGGTQDRTDPVARGWLRMWGPVRVVADVPPCGCGHGRCAICN